MITPATSSIQDQPVLETNTPGEEAYGAHVPARETAVVHRRTVRADWSPAQGFALVGGLLLVVLAAIELAHTGLHFSNLTLDRATVIGLPMTSLAALVTLAAGVLVLGSSFSPRGAKAMTGFMGVLMLAWGLIVAFDPTPFVASWGYDAHDGIFYAVTGFVLLLGGSISPVFVSRRDEMHGSY